MPFKVIVILLTLAVAGSVVAADMPKDVDTVDYQMDNPSRIVIAGTKKTNRKGTREKKSRIETRSWEKKGMKNRIPTITRKMVITK